MIKFYKTYLGWKRAVKNANLKIRNVSTEAQALNNKNRIVGAFNQMNQVLCNSDVEWSNYSEFYYICSRCIEKKNHTHHYGE